MPALCEKGIGSRAKSVVETVISLVRKRAAEPSTTAPTHWARAEQEGSTENLHSLHSEWRLQDRKGYKKRECV